MGLKLKRFLLTHLLTVKKTRVTKSATSNIMPSIMYIFYQKDKFQKRTSKKKNPYRNLCFTFARNDHSIYIVFLLTGAKHFPNIAQVARLVKIKID